MAENPIIIIGGVRYRRDDAKRLGITVKTPEPPATLAAAEVAAAEAAGAGAAVLSTTAANVPGKESEAGKESGNGDNVSGDAGATGDADEAAGERSKPASRARTGKR